MKSRPITAPLHFLPTFELVAQHLSMRHAAAELHLTASAVSQQIRALEQALGFALFRRSIRALHLTAAGKEYAAVVGETLDAYRRGSERLQRQHALRTVRLSCDPYIAHEVLISELASFRALYPQLELRLETSSALADFTRDDVDAAVRFGRGPWPGLVSTLLCPLEATVVCAPGFVKGGRLPTPRSLARYPLLYARDAVDPWLTVERLLGVELSGEKLGFDSYFASLRAAEKGLGLAIGLFPVTSAAVLEGRLMAPLNLRMLTRASLRFVCRKEDAQLPALEALRDWLKQRFGSLPAYEPVGGVIMHEP